MTEEEITEEEVLEEKQEVKETEGGKVRISNQVVTTLAGIAATEVEGVAGMSGGFVGGIAEMLGRENLSKGVKVEVGKEEARIDLSLIMENGVKIHQVAKEVQENVTTTLEDNTGLEVTAVNINVEGVNFEEEEEEKEAEEVEEREEVIEGEQDQEDIEINT